MKFNEIIIKLLEQKENVALKGYEYKVIKHKENSFHLESTKALKDYRLSIDIDKHFMSIKDELGNKPFSNIMLKNEQITDIKINITGNLCINGLEFC